MDFRWIDTVQEVRRPHPSIEIGAPGDSFEEIEALWLVKLSPAWWWIDFVPIQVPIGIWEMREKKKRSLLGVMKRLSPSLPRGEPPLIFCSSLWWCCCVCLLKAFHLEVHTEKKKPCYLSTVCIFDTHGGTANIVVYLSKETTSLNLPIPGTLRCLMCNHDTTAAAAFNTRRIRRAMFLIPSLWSLFMD